MYAYTNFFKIQKWAYCLFQKNSDITNHIVKFEMLKSYSLVRPGILPVECE